jgi:hypothetical protein
MLHPHTSACTGIFASPRCVSATDYRDSKPREPTPHPTVLSTGPALRIFFAAQPTLLPVITLSALAAPSWVEHPANSQWVWLDTEPDAKTRWQRHGASRGIARPMKEVLLIGPRRDRANDDDTVRGHPVVARISCDEHVQCFSNRLAGKVDDLSGSGGLMHTSGTGSMPVGTCIALAIRLTAPGMSHDPRGCW